MTTFLRAFLVGIPLLVLGGVGLSAGWQNSDYETEIHHAVEQPIPFSHLHHVGSLGLECRYCHTGVDREAFAGMPSTETCMSCHSQVWLDAELLAPVRKSWVEGRPLQWQRVNRLPRHVYFHHGAHIQNGVTCVECHGDVGRMPLIQKIRSFTMRDCLACHREKAKLLDPSEADFLTRCNTCHR